MSTLPFNADLLFTVALAVLGLLIGSFLNVLIARLPSGQSIVQPGSRCPKCQHPLPWYENVPVLSWLFLRGKCSACGARISWRYPLVELITALLFLACLRRFDWSWELVLGLMLATFLLPLTFIDLEHWVLPFELTLPGIALGVALSAPLGVLRLRDSMLGAAAGFFGFWAMEWIGRKVFKKEALGGGDKYLLALIGAFLTYQSLLGVVFLASLQGAAVGLALLLVTGRAGPAHSSAAPGDPPPADASAATDDWQPGPTNIPFGPWLSLAALEVMLLQPWLAEVIPWRMLQILVGAG